MYEKHFGLSKRPFRAKATGSDVFVGPQTASIMAGLKKVLVAQDVVATVAGPVGTGKTTIAGKALAALAETHKVVRIGRMHLDGNDVLELLLGELGIRDVPTGAIGKFTAFREHLKLLEASNARLVVLVEDAARLGAETLAEIEALTAADGGESDGANIVLLGDQNLDELLNHPQLGRMRQRRRQRFSVEPLSAAELRGYLLHCFRLAGGDFELVFDNRCAVLVHALSGGVPRIANNLVESALVAGAAAGVAKIPTTLVANVAAEEYGLTADDFDFSVPKIEAETELSTEAVQEQSVDDTVDAEPEGLPVLAIEPGSSPEPDIEPQPAPMPEANAELTPEPLPELAPESQSQPETLPLATAAADSAEQEEPPLEEEDIPELIQDTLPDLEILAPELAAPAAVAPEAEHETPAFEPAALPEQVPKPEAESPAQVTAEPESPAQATAEPEPPVAEAPERQVAEAVEELPELTVEAADAPDDPASKPEDIPDWDRDPTFAELRPDFDALEQAMADVREEANDGALPEPVPEKKPAAAARQAPPVSDEIPEITLDHAIQTGIQDNLIDEPGEISPPAESRDKKSTAGSDVPDIRLPPKQAKKADAELEKIAAELAKAKTIEDVDDRMAETLFGEEINLIAAQVVANPPVAEPANDDVPAVATGTPATAQQVPGAAAETGLGAAAEAGIELALETRPGGSCSGLDLSASQRLKTVRALNANSQPSPADARPARPTNCASEASEAAPAPEPIEDQINTSMTQTLKALNVRPPVATPSHADEDDEQDRKKGGFFGRFRR